MKRRTIPWLAALAAVVLASPLAGQSLGPSARKPAADGFAGAGEYSFTAIRQDMSLHLSLSEDRGTLFAALEAPTTGWVAVGLGSLRMDGAFMVLGFDAAGQVSVREDTGVGRRHSPNPERRLTAQAVRESAGRTTLEIALPAAPFISGAGLRLILAYGRGDNFTSMHASYAQIEVPLAR
ncbi:MAG TPA: DOMON domain-containing protein [Magnetospirillaceae bacterium]|nr:DOMON domain-containing protein [Magnetospirillaceae bacterium]